MAHVKLSALKEGRWYEYAVRFVLGGLATVIAGAVATFKGPEAGGLFLAFPAILCASATLVESHERRKKREHGVEGHQRGTDAAALESAGAGMGSLALICFALVVWSLAEHLGMASLLIGSAVWLLVAFTCWRLRRDMRHVR